MKKVTIWFDMDGTLAGLFFVKNFSERLNSGDMTAYTDAKPLFSINEMAEVITNIKAKGYEIGIISYADEKNLENAKIAKKSWLKKYFPFATKVNIVTKATPKEAFYNNGDILVDDAKANREAWEKVGGKTINAYFKAPIKMIDALKAI
jgi:5'(3')-deoxyribonucleotidase